MTLDALKLGQVVMSTQGRDAGRLFIVVGFAEENFVSNVKSSLEAARAKGYADIRADHIADFTSYMERCTLALPEDEKAGMYFQSRGKAGKRRQDLRCGDPKGAGSPEGSRIGCALQGG